MSASVTTSATTSTPSSTPSEVGGHRCARAGRCVRAEVDDAGRRRGCGTELADTLCAGCTSATRRALDALPRTYTELEIILDVHAAAGEKVSGSPEPPIPPRLDVLVTQADIDAEVTTWAEPVAEQLGVAWDTARMAAHRPGPRVQRAAHLLACHVELLCRLGPTDVLAWGLDGWAATTRTGTDAAVRLLDLHHRARLLVTGGAGDVRLPVPCPSCQGTLLRRNGMAHVDCQSCPRSWPEADYRRLCLILADDYRAVAA